MLPPISVHLTFSGDGSACDIAIDFPGREKMAVAPLWMLLSGHVFGDECRATPAPRVGYDNAYYNIGDVAQFAAMFNHSPEFLIGGYPSSAAPRGGLLANVARVFATVTQASSFAPHYMVRTGFDESLNELDVTVLNMGRWHPQFILTLDMRQGDERHDEFMALMLELARLLEDAYDIVE